MDEYYVKYTLPKRYVTKEFEQLLIDAGIYEQGNHIKDILFDEGADEGDGTACFSIEYSDPDGNQMVNEYLEKHKVPHNLYCSEGNGYDASRFVYRPEENYIEENLTNTGWEPVIKLQYLEDILDSSNIKEDLEKVLRQHCAYGVSTIDECNIQTEIGKNKKAMESIDQILDALDEGKIDQEEAMQRISTVTKGGKKSEA